MMTSLRASVLHDGCNLAYEVEGGGPPVLFIQGVGLHGRGWSPQVDELRSHYRCIHFDNRGMAASQPPGTRITIEQMADDAFALLDATGSSSAHIVGHSMGGPIALQMALSQPDRVRSLSLLCTVAKGSDATRLTLRMLWLGIRSRVGTRRSRRRAFLEIVMPHAILANTDIDALARDLEPIFGHDLADQPAIAMKQLSALRAFDASLRLDALRETPTLVMSAAHDPIAPPKFGRAIAQAIKGARYVEFDDASHGLPLQHPAKVNAMLIEHIDAAENAFMRSQS